MSDGPTPATSPTSSPLLSATGITRHYGGVAALTDADLALAPGEIRALVGENGAGKSTFVKALAGLITVDAGEFHLDGQPYAPHRSRREVAVVHQELAIVPDLSVLDNVLLGHPDVRGLLRRSRHAAEVREHLAVVGLDDVPLDLPAGRLSLAERQLVEIARVLMRRARVVVLDEPTATLTENEVQRVFAAVRSLAETGCAVLFISHRLRELYDLCDTVTIFRNGRVVAHRDLASLERSDLVTLMIGERPAAGGQAASVTSTPGQAEPAQAAAGLVVPGLHVRGLAVPGLLEPLDLDVQPGQVVGVVGRLGSGADVVVRVLSGSWGEEFGGTVTLGGRPVTLRTVRTAMASGVVHVSDDRARDGVFLTAPISMTLTSSVLGRIARAGWLVGARERSFAQGLVERFGVKTSSVQAPVNSLSGGNQQKVALARAVGADPDLLVLNEPTRGVDIGARHEIESTLRTLARTGVPILLHTTDVAEALSLCDVLVSIDRGRVVRVAQVSDLDERTVIADITGEERSA